MRFGRVIVAAIAVLATTVAEGALLPKCMSRIKVGQNELIIESGHLAHVLYSCLSTLTGRFKMATPARRETMQRKAILMSPRMISKIDKIARGKKVSFAEVVREAVDAFDSGLSQENMALLEALADTMIKTTQEVVEKIEAVEKRLDETHAMLEAR